MLSKQQRQTFDRLCGKTDFDPEIVHDGGSEGGTAVFHLPFPGLFVTVTRDGKIVKTETDKQVLERQSKD